MKPKKKYLFLIVAFFLVIGLLELFIFVFTLISTKAREVISSPYHTTTLTPHTVPDKLLGYRPNPEYPGHDSNGFRNDFVPDNADIVCMGDSQTYGTGVELNDAWPKQLEDSIKKSVYSIAFGGYGPVHSLALLDEALKLRPKIVIEAFNVGNDLYDSFEMVYYRNNFYEFKSSDVNIINAVQKAEEVETIHDYVEKMFDILIEKYKEDNYRKFYFRGFLSEYSQLYGLLRRVKYELFSDYNALKKKDELIWKKAKSFANSHREFCEIFDNGKLKTVFIPKYRLSAMNLDDPRIAEGLQIALQSIHKMNHILTAQGVKFVVVVIPTKEYVFENIQYEPSDDYKRIIEYEKKFRALAFDYLKKHDIEYVDPLPFLQDQLSSLDQPYHLNQDGHLNKYGHKAMSLSVKLYIAL